jgi:hypothetical protein
MTCSFSVELPGIEFGATRCGTGNDVVRPVPTLTLHGYGHYHETYEKIDGRWRIKTSKLTRLREDVTVPMFAPRIA